MIGVGVPPLRGPTRVEKTGPLRSGLRDAVRGRL
jgi:hypothetical protein